MSPVFGIMKSAGGPPPAIPLPDWARLSPPTRRRLRGQP